MENLIYSIFNLLTTSPGNLVYHLVLGFSVIAALQTVITPKRVASAPIPTRTILGLSFILVGLILAFVATGLAWQGSTNLHYLSPPLDRAVINFSFILIVWLWLFPKSNRLVDSLTFLAVFLTILAFLFSLAYWSAQPSTLPFNGSNLDQVWVIASALILGIGIVALLFSRPSGWGVGFSMMLLNLVGLGAHFFWADLNSDLSGAIRLAQLCTFPLLASLSQRSTIIQEKVEPTIQNSPLPVFKERRKHSADPRTVFVLLQIAADADQHNITTHLAHAVAQTMFADMCYFLTCTSPQADISLVSGYDLIREQPLPPTSVDRNLVATLANAVSRGKALRLGGENGDSPDLLALAQAVGLSGSGNILLIPLKLPITTSGAILLLSPYSNRHWTLEDQSYLANSIDIISSIFARSISSNPNSIHPSENNFLSGQAFEALLQQLESLRQENHLLLTEISLARQTDDPSGDQLSASPNPTPSTNPLPIPIAEVIDFAIAACRTQIQEKKLTIHADFPPDLPDIVIDRDALEQIVLSLVQNAVFASPEESSVNLRLVIEGQDSPSRNMLLQVTDFGGGIDPRDLPFVFSKRDQSQSTQINRFGNHGVELSIAKTWVETHHGKIWVESEPGSSTATVSVLFPLQSSSQQEFNQG